MLKNKFTYLIIFTLSLLIFSLNTNPVLIHTGKSRIYQLVLGAIIIIIGGVIFVFVIDKLLSPKPKKKLDTDKKSSDNITDKNSNKKDKKNKDKKNKDKKNKDKKNEGNKDKKNKDK